MKKKTRRIKATLRPLGKSCKRCLPDLRYTVLTPQEIMELPTNDSIAFSLKVYAAAYMLGMQELTDAAHSAYACALLEECADEIARGHVIESR